MKIKFIDSTIEYENGAKLTYIHGRELVCGESWKNRITNERGITVVRQKSRWFTALILIHELAHHFTQRLFKHKLRARIHIWIDKYIKRKRDKK